MLIPSNLILSYSDADHAPVIKTDGTIELPFENEVIAGCGDIILSNGSDTRKIAITDTSQVTFSSSKFGNYVIINPAQDLVANTHYSIQMASNVIADKHGHVNAAIDDPETLSFNTVDSAPLLFSSNIDNTLWNPGLPAELAADGDIGLYFDETVIPGNGSIILSNGSDTRVIDIQDTSQVTFGGGDGSSVVINPATDLIPNTSYHLQIASGVITDTAGNAYAGNNDPDALSFVATPADPELYWSNLWNESTLKVDESILLYFGEAVQAGSGAIVISNGSDTRTIDIHDASQVTFEGYSNFTIKPSADLIPGTTYTVQMAAGVIADVTGHAFHGIGDQNAMSFTTIASDPLLYGIDAIGSLAPPGEITFKVDDGLLLKFDEPVLPANGDIIISNGTDTRTIDIHDSSQVTFDDYGQVFIKPLQDWVLDTLYTIRVAAGAVTDKDGNVFAGTDAQSELSFTSVNSNPLLLWTNFMASDDQPFLSAGNLWNEQLIQRPDSGIQLFFDEKVAAGNGKIILSSDSDTRIIDIHDTSQVMFDEYGDVFIHPSDNLLPHTTYHIEIADGVIADIAGNPYAGIHDATALEFTTTDPYFITMTDFV
ncbi:MAG: Ig-like domain-containing protein [Gammaproteobacteria bacterium]|nr:MAG: Ig-like domain-containing protein [Gammaproteobacteria bacterium]